MTQLQGALLTWYIFLPQDVYVVKEYQLKKKKKRVPVSWSETLYVYIAQIVFNLYLL